MPSSTSSGRAVASNCDAGRAKATDDRFERRALERSLNIPLTAQLDRPNPLLLRGQEHAGVHEARRVEGVFDATQGGEAAGAELLPDPLAPHPADAVMV